MTPALFDPAALAARAARAARLWPAGAAAHEQAAALLAERLEDVTRPFPRAAVVGAGGGAYARAVRGRAGEARLMQLEAHAALAALAAEAGETRVGPPEALEVGGYDLILNGLTLHREDDPVGMLIRLRRALAPDGLLLAAVPAGRTLHELRAAMAQAEIDAEGGLSPRVSPMADLRELGAALQRAGYAMPVADVERIALVYPDPLALMRDLRAHGEANALAERRRTPLRRATLAAACAAYAAGFPAAGGGVAATVELAILTGWAPGPGQPVPKRPGSATARLAEALATEERPLPRR